ncbi:MAG: hypothetical protein AB1468_06945 [Candidatus Micrarchaeota archaeon]
MKPKDLLYLKPHLFAAMAMFVAVVLMISDESKSARALLLIPVVLLYVLSLVLYGAQQKFLVEDAVEKKIEREKRKKK